MLYRALYQAGYTAVRRADPKTLIVADGTSCRHQIADGTERAALHVARVLAMSLDHSSFRGANGSAAKRGAMARTRNLEIPGPR